MADIGSKERTAVFAEEDFVVESQIFLHQLMEEKGFSRADLARAMGVTRARVSQIFSDECKNFTVRLLARAVHALGEMPELRRKQASREGALPDCWKETFLGPEELQSLWEVKQGFNEIKSLLPCNDVSPTRLQGYDYSPLEWEAA